MFGRGARFMRLLGSTMRNALLLLVIAPGVIEFAACAESTPVIDRVEAGSDPALAAAGTGLFTGLPCEVQAVLENRCIVCHDGTQNPPLLLNYDHLVAPSVRDPSKSRAVAAVDLMRGQAMPPRP